MGAFTKCQRRVDLLNVQLRCQRLVAFVIYERVVTFISTKTQNRFSQGVKLPIVIT